MSQKLVQQQDLRLQQVQRLSQQQMLQVRLLEMPITELEQSVHAELDDNPALESDGHDDACDFSTADNTYGDSAAGDSTSESDESDTFEREERRDALEDALEGIGRDDDMPTASWREDGPQSAEYEETVWGDTTSFYDKLKEQTGELDLNDTEQQVMEYIIGSLDNDGLLRKSNADLADELAIYHGLDVTEEDVANAVAQIQTFDPAGIGARDLRECLLLQIDRRPEGRMRNLMHTVIADHFTAFTKKHWNRIAADLSLSPEAAEELQNELHRLNPKPGAAMGETIGRSMQQITPDFIIDTQDDGTITLTLNSGDLPRLKVSPAFTSLVETYRANKASMTRRDKEALLYAKEKVDKAAGFIEAVNQRRRTLTLTMQAIIDWQRPFFLDGDEADLRPMILKNIAERTGLDISTVSRVSNVKYAQTKWGTFPLRFFFSDGYTTGQGEELSTRRIKMALRDIIAKEDKHRPMSDDALATAMAKAGYPIARRTIAKYREQLGLPVARLRKK